MGQFFFIPGSKGKASTKSQDNRVNTFCDILLAGTPRTRKDRYTHTQEHRNKWSHIKKYRVLDITIKVFLLFTHCKYSRVIDWSVDGMQEEAEIT